MSATKLLYNIASSYEECIGALQEAGQPVHVGEINGTRWCNATWDSILCWPAIPGNSTYTLSCPPMKGLVIEKQVTKRCHESGHWAGQVEGDFSNPSGWTNYLVCMLIDSEVIEKAQGVARSARKLEFVGLALSFFSLIIAITIFSTYRRLRVFRNQVHVQLMLAILLTVVIRLMIYIDQIFTENMSRSQLFDDGYTINTVRFVCEIFYALLEYGKTVAFAWMFIEGFYLHNLVVVKVFDGEPKLWKYLIIGWGVPIIHVFIWLTVIVAKRGIKNVERCLGHYYLHPEFWIMDSIRLLELLVNFAFLLSIIRILWSKVKENTSPVEAKHLKKSVRAAVMLIPLLGIPNIMQTIPFTPSKDNIDLFQIFTYIASFFYMFQGFMVAVMYCFTNREVICVLRASYNRYQLRRTSASSLRRGSHNALLRQRTRTVTEVIAE